MGRKRKRFDVEGATGGVAADGGHTSAKGGDGRDGVPPVRVPTWEELVKRAEADLDEKGEESLAKWVRSAEKKRKRDFERGIVEPYDIDGIKRALVRYYVEVTGSGKGVGFIRLMESEGVCAGDFFGGGEDRHAEFRLVYCFICKLMHDIELAKAKDMVPLVHDGQRRLISEEGCGLNQRAVEVSLKATMKDVYGPGDEKGEEKMKSVVYILPGLKIENIMSPGEIAAKKLDGSRLVSEAIDV